MDNQGNGLGNQYKGFCICNYWYGLCAQTLHPLLAALQFDAFAIRSYAYDNHLHSRVDIGAYGGSGNQFGHAWRMSPVIINAIVIRKTGALCPSRTLSKRFLASCKVIQDSPSGCSAQGDLGISNGFKSVHPIGNPINHSYRLGLIECGT